MSAPDPPPRSCHRCRPRSRACCATTSSSQPSSRRRRCSTSRPATWSGSRRVQPGKTICRVRERGRRGPDRLRAAGARRGPAQGGRRGRADRSADDRSGGRVEGWQREFSKEVIAEAQGRGLTTTGGPRAGRLSLWASARSRCAGLLFLAGFVGGDTTATSRRRGLHRRRRRHRRRSCHRRHRRWLGRSLDQLPTDEGKRRRARCLGLQRHLHENEHSHESPAGSCASVGPALRVRRPRWAWLAQPAVALLPIGAEDDNGAWSRFGGRWRRVRVRYPRGWPAGLGEAPRVRARSSPCCGARRGRRALRADGLAQSAADPITATDPPVQPATSSTGSGRVRSLLDDPVRARPVWVDLPAGARRARLLGPTDEHRRARAGTARGSRTSSRATRTARRSTGTTSRSTTARTQRIRSWRVRRDAVRRVQPGRDGRRVGTPRTSATCASSGPVRGAG